jgi:hypothetical protein
MPKVSLYIRASVRDAPFLAFSVPAIVRALDYPFGERVLYLDLPAALSGDYARETRINYTAALDSARRDVGDLVAGGWIDRVLEVEYAQPKRTLAATREYVRPAHRIGWRWTHDVRGAPLAGSFLEVADAARSGADYFVHSDADMIYHQRPGYSWVAEGAERLATDPSLLYFRPHSGPVGDDGEVTIQNAGRFTVESTGHKRFASFSNRNFMADPKRMLAVGPYPLVPIGPIRFLKRAIRGKSPFACWEDMVARQMIETGLTGLESLARDAWSLHPLIRTDDWMKMWPRVLSMVEAGRLPEGQLGYYDIRPDAWAPLLTSATA